MEINKLVEKHINEAEKEHSSHAMQVSTEGVVSCPELQASRQMNIQRSRSHNIVQPNMPLQRQGAQVITTAPQMAHTIVQTNMPANVQVITIPPQKYVSYNHQTPEDFKKRYTTHQICHNMIQSSSESNIYIIRLGPSAQPIQSGPAKNQQLTQGIQRI